MSKKIYRQSNMWDDRITMSNADSAKPIFIIKTKKSIFKANDLNSCMILWKESNDKSEVISVHKLG